MLRSGIFPRLTGMIPENNNREECSMFDPLIPILPIVTAADVRHIREKLHDHKPFAMVKTAWGKGYWVE